MPQFDTIIIGAGHNGLVCAAYLAKAGHRVLVLEASDAPGGLAASREFHPGFAAPVASFHSHFAREIIADLALASHGLGSAAGPARTVGLDVQGKHIVADPQTLKGCGNDDTSAYPRFMWQMQKFADALRPFWLKTMPRPGSGALADIATFAHIGLNLRRLGKQDMGEFLRVASLPARDLLDEYFASDGLKAMLAWDSLIGSKMAPRSPNGAVLTMLYRLSEAGNSEQTHTADSTGALIKSLSRAATAAGADIRCRARVQKVTVDGSAEGLRATGVLLENGEQINARRVVSSADPQQTFLQLVGVQHLDIGFTNRIRRLRCDGLVAKLHLALDGLPQFTGLGQPTGRLIAAGSLDTIEFAYDDAKYGNCPTTPVIEMQIPSLDDASLAPPGQHVLSANVMYVPYQPKGGWTDAAREQCSNTAIDAIAKYAPGLREQILKAQFLTPFDLEREYGVTGGHWHHTEFAMDQMLMMRPTYEAAQYTTPVPGLYLCGAGCHPAGDLTGAAGYNSAREILR